MNWSENKELKDDYEVRTEHKHIMRIFILNQGIN